VCEEKKERGSAPEGFMEDEREKSQGTLCSDDGKWFIWKQVRKGSQRMLFHQRANDHNWEDQVIDMRVRDR
jgi:hypothetical protein